MRGRARTLPCAALLALAGLAGAAELDRLATRRIDVRDAAQTQVVVRADGIFQRTVDATDGAVFAAGIDVLGPAAGLSMGAFTRTEDFAAATQGQVKEAVRGAVRDFAAAGYGADAVAVPVYTAAGDDLAVCLGQLKAAAAPFWRHLVACGATNAAPWSGAASGVASDDLALVNVGQVKAAFAFGFASSAEPSGIPVATDGEWDTDGDGMSDGWERAHGLDPTDPSDGGADADGDGRSNAAEYADGTDPGRADAVTEPPTDQVRRIAFTVGGDYAAWELAVEGLGPDDFRTRRLVMPRPDRPVQENLVLRKRNSYRLSMKWRNCVGHEDDEVAPWHCWELRLDDLPAGRTFDIGLGMAVRNEKHKVVHGDGWVLDNASGLASTHTCTHAQSGRNIAQGLTATLHVLGDPVLALDYDRDRAITDAEVKRAKAENPPFRFWINDDADKGDVCSDGDYLSDTPGKGPDAGDGKVGGRRDLVDFTPVWIGVGEVFPPDCPQRLRDLLSWRLKGPVNAVWTRAVRREAGAFQHFDIGGCGRNLDHALREADTTSLQDWTVLPQAFAKVLASAGDGGVFLVEGASRGEGLHLEGRWTDDGGTAVAATADLKVDGVEKMYRWLCLRDVRGQSGLASSVDAPVHRPDESCDGRNIVFVHGFNVNPEEARATGAEVFKRLWQSGSESMFTVVDWYGDDSQFGGWISDATACPNYYANVAHAFGTAAAFAARLGKLPGRKVVLAHSLGNMLVSAAASDHRLDYARYYMLNAAVAQEAFDVEAKADAMVDSDWKNVPESYRASGWHALFPTNDFRSCLYWRGRFKGLHDVVNCYSDTENVVGNRGGLFWDPVWKTQERWKGTRHLHEANAFLLEGYEVACEGGWGVNAYYGNDVRYYFLGFNQAVAELALTNVIAHPLFTPFRTEAERMSATNRFEVAEAAARAELRAKFLADAIPATSLAMGGNAVTAGMAGFQNFQLDGGPVAGGEWPSERKSWGSRRWLHSDLKNVAYFYVHALFDRIVNESK